MNELVDISGTPYYLETEEESRAAIGKRLSQLADRVDLLRRNKTLTEDTLKRYYGEKRFEQIAESNALEGSTLSAGETELAVLRGITVTGHDPAFSRDAQALAQALDRLTQLAQRKDPTTLDEVREIHALVVGERQGSGVFRTSEVRIRGSQHTPPRTWPEVMRGMEQWQQWSMDNASAPPLLRATVLHAWLTHIHPFVDGNGRTSRAISNLELIRAGYPPIIIRRKDRDRYLDGLAEADQGRLGPFVDLMSQRAEDALRDLERAASAVQGYDVLKEKRRKVFEGRLAVWNAGVHLLVESLRARLHDQLDRAGAAIEVKEYDELTVDDFTELCEGRMVGQTWAFKLTCSVFPSRRVTWLCWAGYLRRESKEALGRSGVDVERPALMWSVPTGSYPPWRPAEGNESPAGEQMTIARDKWVVIDRGRTQELSASELADRLTARVVEGLVPSAEL